MLSRLLVRLVVAPVGRLFRGSSLTFHEKEQSNCYPYRFKGYTHSNSIFTKSKHEIMKKGTTVRQKDKVTTALYSCYTLCNYMHLTSTESNREMLTSHWQLVQCFSYLLHVFSFHGHPFARAHCRILRWPPQAASEHVDLSQEHSFALNHCRIIKCPFLAAWVQACLDKRHPWSFNHIKAASCPCLTALSEFFSLQACKCPCWCDHSKMSNRPCDAAPFKITRSCGTSVPASCRYNSTQDTDDTKVSIVVVLSAPTLLLRYFTKVGRSTSNESKVSDTKKHVDES
jgi:hypothetical protein